MSIFKKNMYVGHTNAKKSELKKTRIHIEKFYIAYLDGWVKETICLSIS